eukprot:JP435870.1.p1 GENE.JP435870.1~~JP435870.1.p1  ORF type:complete len:384 (-),score=101.56 JP435870.1:71-1078(-)
MKATFAAHNEPNGLVEGKPVLVSKDPADVIPQSDVIVMPLPSFAYWDILAAIKPHLKEGTFLCVTPGQGGFGWIAQEVLGDVYKKVITFATLPMPFNCRITDFGKHVGVQTFKRHYRVGTYPPEASDKALEINTQLFGESQSIGHLLSCALYPINAIIHPQRLYRLLKDYKAGDVLPENPLFYESMDVESTDLMDVVNKELIAVGAKLRELGINVDVPHLFDFLQYVYGPSETPVQIFLNDAYKGFRCPFKAVEGGFQPDFTNRYFTEDIPLGLCLYKGVADIVGVSTPMMDTVLVWAQGHMGKEYVVNGKLTGKDVGETSAPQRFGVTTVEGLR